MYIFSVDSKFLPWTGWSCCSTTCGPGVRSRSRDCLPSVGPGQECPNPPKQVEKEDCVTRKCAGKNIYLTKKQIYIADNDYNLIYVYF